MRNLMILILGGVIFFGCSNKRIENNIKSLEKRVANLERRMNDLTVRTERRNPNNSLLSQQPEGKYPVITFKETTFDFGTIHEGDVVDHVFEFENTGDFPLVIQKATATCGCTVPEWPKKPIKVGEKGVIKVKFNSFNKKNKQTKYVTILANTKPSQTRLKITGMVIPKEENK